MLQKILFLVLLPVLVWMLIGSYKEIKRDFQIENDRDFIFRILWIFSLLYAAAAALLLVFFDSAMVLSLKPW